MTTLSKALAASVLLALSGCIAPPATVYGAPAVAAAPPPQAYTQPYPVQPAATFCAAGVYQCPIAPGTPVGTSCACAGLGAPSYGVAQ